MKRRIRIALGLLVGAVTMTALGSGAAVASATPPTPPPNPGGHYGSGYQDLVDDLGVTLNRESYDGNGNFVLENMFGSVCNNPGYICS